MNKKMILAILGCPLTAYICYGFYQTSGLRIIHIEKTVTINGTTKEVFEMVKYLKNFPKWSPFLAQGSSEKYEIKGADGTIGAQYHWQGNNGKDLGYRQIVKIDELKHVGMKCDIQKPFVAGPTFDYYFSET